MIFLYIDMCTYEQKIKYSVIIIVTVFCQKLYNLQMTQTKSVLCFHQLHRSKNILNHIKLKMSRTLVHQSTLLNYFLILVLCKRQLIC